MFFSVSIYEYLIDNIEKKKKKNIYIILRYIKNLLIEKTIKLNEKIISYIKNQSLNKEVLDFNCQIVTLEKLEKLMIPYIFELNPSIFLEKEEKEEKEGKNKIDEISTKSNKGESFLFDQTSPDIFLSDNSLFYRCGEMHSLGFNYQYKKIYNIDTFIKPKKFLKIFNNIKDATNYNEKCILFSKDLQDLEEIPNNVSYIIIPDYFKDEKIIKEKYNTIPIIMIEGTEYKNISDNVFEKGSFNDLENLFAISLQSDASLLINIPDEKVPDFAENQRDALIEILGGQPNYELKNKEDDDDQEETDLNNEEFKQILCGKSINNIDKNSIFNKLISLISRRMVITVVMTQKTKINQQDLEKLIKLLLYENLV